MLLRACRGVLLLTRGSVPLALMMRLLSRPLRLLVPPLLLLTHPRLPVLLLPRGRLASRMLIQGRPGLWTRRARGRCRQALRSPRTLRASLLVRAWTLVLRVSVAARTRALLSARPA